MVVVVVVMEVGWRGRSCLIRDIVSVFVCFSPFYPFFHVRTYLHCTAPILSRLANGKWHGNGVLEWLLGWAGVGWNGGG